MTMIPRHITSRIIIDDETRTPYRLRVDRRTRTALGPSITRYRAYLVPLGVPLTPPRRRMDIYLTTHLWTPDHPEDSIVLLDQTITHSRLPDGFRWSTP